MKNIKVLGSGCANCKRTLALIEETAKARGVDVELERPGFRQLESQRYC